MTMKPKARKFRVSRERAEDDAVDATVSDSTPKRRATDRGRTSVGATSIDAIKQEGLTARQLRMARRIAQRNGMSPNSDYDAVKMLREKGIDPFKRSNVMELVVPEAAAAGATVPEGDHEKTSARLPSTMTAPANLPGPELSPIERRNIEIRKVQREISKRRRRKVALLLVRLSFFVFAPTFLAGHYFYNMATPMYSSKSEFAIEQSENRGGSGFGNLLSGTQFATNADSIQTQGFLNSKEAMIRLDADVGFKDHFTQEHIDPIQRLDPDPTNEQAYKTYKRHVKVGFDPTEGVLRMEVTASDPEFARLVSDRLISYAEERVNNLSQTKREDQMRDARQSYEEAEEQRRAAQETLVRLQLEGATLDPEAVIASLRSQISSVETQLLEKELQLAALLDNARPNRARVDGATADVRRLKDQLELLNSRMLEASEGQNSLAETSVRIQMAQADLATRDMLLQSALQQMEQTRLEANRQVRYLTIAVTPVASEEPSYPRAFENTILAFLIFAGIYLMISLTASILREQVTT